MTARERLRWAAATDDVHLIDTVQGDVTCVMLPQADARALLAALDVPESLLKWVKSIREHHDMMATKYGFESDAAARLEIDNWLAAYRALSGGEGG